MANNVNDQLAQLMAQLAEMRAEQKTFREEMNVKNTKTDMQLSKLCSGAVVDIVVKSKQFYSAIQKCVNESETILEMKRDMEKLTEVVNVLSTGNALKIDAKNNELIEIKNDTVDPFLLSDLRFRVSVPKFGVTIKRKAEFLAASNDDRVNMKSALETRFYARNGIEFADLTFPSTAEATTVKDALFANHPFLGDDVKLFSTKFSPKIRIIGIPPCTSEEVLAACKSWENVDEGMVPIGLDNIELLDIYSPPRGNGQSQIAVIRVPSVELFKAILAGKFIRILLRDCRVFEELPIEKCNKCAAYGHKAFACSAQVRCRNCAGLHYTSSCNSMVVRCINCITLNQTANENWPDGHRAWHPRCHAQITYVNKLKWDYGHDLKLVNF